MEQKDERQEAFVDETLIDEMLKLTPLERLRMHDNLIAMARTLQGGVRQLRDVNNSSTPTLRRKRAGKSGLSVQTGNSVAFGSTR